MSTHAHAQQNRVDLAEKVASLFTFFYLGGKTIFIYHYRAKKLLNEILISIWLSVRVCMDLCVCECV